MPSLAPQVAVSHHVTFIGHIHAVGHEDLVKEHVGVAEVVRMADMGIGLVLVAFDDLAHLLRRQIGVQPLAEFKGQGFDGGSWRCWEALLMASYSAWPSDPSPSPEALGSSSVRFQKSRMWSVALAIRNVAGIGLMLGTQSCSSSSRA